MADFIVSASYDPTTGVISGTTSGAEGAVQYAIFGLEDWKSGNTFQTPTWQRNGVVFTLRARTATQYNQVDITASPTATPPPTTPVVPPPAPSTGGVFTVSATHDPATNLITVNSSGASGTVQYQISGLRGFGPGNTFEVPSQQRDGTYTFYIDALSSTNQAAATTIKPAVSGTTTSPGTTPTTVTPGPTPTTVITPTTTSTGTLVVSGSYNPATGLITTSSTGAVGAVTYSIVGVLKQTATTFFLEPHQQSAGDTFTLTATTATQTATASLVVVPGASSTTPTTVTPGPTPTTVTPGPTPVAGAFTVSATHDPATNLITVSSSGASGTVQYAISGLRGYGAGNTFEVPSHQRNGTYTFDIEALSSTNQYATTSIKPATSGTTVSPGTPTTVTSGPTPGPSPGPTPVPGPSTGGAFTVSATHDPATNLITVSSSGASGTVQYAISGLRGYGAGNTFEVPSHQRNGTYTFDIEALSSTNQYATTSIKPATSGTTVSPGTTPTTVTPGPTPTTPVVPSPGPVPGTGVPASGFGVTVGYNATTGVITANTYGAVGAVQYAISGLEDWKSGTTFQVPIYQRSGVTFTVRARTATQYAQVDFTTSGTSVVNPIAPAPAPSNLSLLVLRAKAIKIKLALLLLILQLKK